MNSGGGGGDLYASVYIFMYLRAMLCTFQISVDFYYVPEGGREGGRRGLEKGGLECILHVWVQ